MQDSGQSANPKCDPKFLQVKAAILNLKCIRLLIINENYYEIRMDIRVYKFIYNIIYKLEMATGRASRGQSRAGPENPGPRASRAETGLKIFYLKVLCATENSNFC